MMDIGILVVSKKILRCSASHKDIFFGALAGAVLTCLVVILPIPYRVVKFVLFHGVINIVMIKTGLRIQWDRRLIKAYFVVYISSVFIGGLISLGMQYIRAGRMFFVCASVSCWLSLRAWDFVRKLIGSHRKECDVLLCNGDMSVMVNAMIDTGNRLRDPLTGKPVSIVERETFKAICQQNCIQSLRYISYHTIGKTDGVMPLIAIERMCLYLEEEYWVEKPLIAISNENLGEGTYKMILSPDV